jgi:hypothetical protein
VLPRRVVPCSFDLSNGFIITVCSTFCSFDFFFLFDVLLARVGFFATITSSSAAALHAALASLLPRPATPPPSFLPNAVVLYIQAPTFLNCLIRPSFNIINYPLSCWSFISTVSIFTSEPLLGSDDTYRNDHDQAAQQLVLGWIDPMPNY